MAFDYYIVDAFVSPDKSFSGNPAAVVILGNDSDISDAKKQAIAGEFNLAETVFVSKLVEADEEAQLLIRWFSPETEVELCGHATVAVSYILFTEQSQYSGLVKANEPIRYRTRFGLNLQASFDGQYVTLNFPVNDPVPIQYGWIDDLKRALVPGDKQDLFVNGAQLSPNRFLLLRLRDDADIAVVRPDFTRLLELDVDNQLNAVIVTKKNNFDREGTHFASRVFGPWVGINEDPVTGSSFTALVPFWSSVYLEEYGQEMDLFHATQASHRTGLVRTQLTEGETRVLIAGQVNKFSAGSFHLQ